MANNDSKLSEFRKDIRKIERHEEKTKEVIFKMRTESSKQMKSILTKLQKIKKKLPNAEGEEDSVEQEE